MSGNVTPMPPLAKATPTVEPQVKTQLSTDEMCRKSYLIALRAFRLACLAVALATAGAPQAVKTVQSWLQTAAAQGAEQQLLPGGVCALVISTNGELACALGKGAKR